MRTCDLTLAYTDTCGGIRAYIDQKRRWINENSNSDAVKNGAEASFGRIAASAGKRPSMARELQCGLQFSTAAP